MLVLLPLLLLLAATVPGSRGGRAPTPVGVGSAYTPVQVNTTLGPIVGRQLADGSKVFNGIPFASPPIGDLRLRAAVRPDAWTDVLDCTRRRDICVQGKISDALPLGSEDCLFLDVYVPPPTAGSEHGAGRAEESTNEAVRRLNKKFRIDLDALVAREKRDGEGLAVFFWIYGGGFTKGDGWEFSIYDGAAIAKHFNVVVVTPNYRLDVLGYLALDELAAEDPFGSTGNYGTSDQRMAMVWAQNDIVNFGGDPQRVLIVGESAGGMSVAAHLGSERSAGLFHAAIMESGPTDTPAFFQPKVNATAFGKIYASAVGCNATTDGGDLVGCLRGKSVGDLFTAFSSYFSPDWPFSSLEAASAGAANVRARSEHVFGSLGRTPPVVPMIAPLMPFGPCIDGSEAGLKDTPLNLIKSGKWNAVPVITGTNENEGTIFVPMAAIVVHGVKLPLDEDGFKQILDHFFLPYNPGADAAGLRAKIAAQYPLSDFKNNNERAAFLLRDWFFRCSARRTARAVTAQGKPAYSYIFTYPEHWPENSILGDYHASELVMVFDRSFPVIHEFNANDTAVASAFGHYWTNHAKNGDPNVGMGSLPHWPLYDSTDPVLDIDSGTPKVVHNPSGARCDFWDQMIPL